MQDFTDTPVALKFFDRLEQIATIIATQLGAGFKVERQTLYSGTLGEFPGLRVTAERSDAARFDHRLDLFVCWQPETMEAFVNSSNRSQAQVLERMPSAVLDLMREGAGERAIDFSGRSQDSPDIEWLHLKGFAHD